MDMDKKREGRKTDMRYGGVDDWKWGWKEGRKKEGKKVWRDGGRRKDGRRGSLERWRKK